MARNPGPSDMDSERANLFLANERTFLAHVRTGVAIMAFGFVVAKFALFLRGLGDKGNVPPNGHDTVIGAATTCLGTVVVLLGAIRYTHRQHAIRRGAMVTSPVLDLAVAGLLAAGGIGLAAFLLLQGGR